MVRDYRVCIEGNAAALEAGVMSFIERGFQPYGSLVAVTSNTGHVSLCQPMVRRDSSLPASQQEGE